MADIKVLDDKTINQIAAGEVVERPVSVVKELVENSIDAGASSISIEIKDGGIGMIRITDNGSGISPDNIKTAFCRHATSKIKSIEDLINVKSLGFRGEALSSIAAVAQIELLTKTKDNVFGIRYCLNGGKEMSFDEVGVPDGTTIIVRNLFFNTPARRKFLKSPTTEANYISELVERLILSHPDVSFKFTVNGKEKLVSYGDGDVKNSIYGVYGRQLASLVMPVDYETEDFKITGFIGKPETGRGNRNFEIFFVNGRFVKSKILSKAVEEAYKSYLMMHKYPFVCLYFDIKSEDLDVNVHPAKTEIRFLKEQEVYRGIIQCIEDCMSSKELIVEADVEEDIKKNINKSEATLNLISSNISGSQTANIKTSKEDINNENFDLENSFIKVSPFEEITELEIQTQTQTQSFPEVPMAFPEPFEEDKLQKAKEQNQILMDKEITNIEQQTFLQKEFLVKENISLHKIVGQVFDTYWIVEYDGKMYIIDQHAAHEKVLYERFKKRIDEDNVFTQSLSPAIIVTLNFAEIDALNSYMDNFKKLGFEIEHFGGREYAITGVPTDLFGLSEKDYFMEVLDDLVQNPKISDSKSVNDRIATMACKAAIKGNMRFSFAEADALIKELLSLENPYNCPHGRPTIVSYKKQDLEKLFKRIV